VSQGDQVIQVIQAIQVSQIFLEDLLTLAALAILAFHVTQIFLAAQSILWGLRVLTGQ
jgi:hypothetical protein